MRNYDTRMKTVLTFVGRFRFYLACIIGIVVSVALAGTFFAIRTRSSEDLLVISYDSTRDYFDEIGSLLRAHGTCLVDSRHGGSLDQSRAVIRGLRADAVLLATPLEIENLAAKGLIVPDWKTQFPYGSSPFSAPIVFLVRAHNPKNIVDWTDLERPDVKVSTTHPDVSGAGRLAFLALYHSAARSGTPKIPEAFCRRVYSRADCLSMGAHAAANFFATTSQGDVLLTWENEARRATGMYGTNKLTVVFPPSTILGEPVAALINNHAQERHSGRCAMQLFDLMFSVDGQRSAARNYLRPRAAQVQQEFASQFPPVAFFTVEEAFGGWSNVMKIHFSPGGTVERVIPKKRLDSLP